MKRITMLKYMFASIAVAAIGSFSALVAAEEPTSIEKGKEVEAGMVIGLMENGSHILILTNSALELRHFIFVNSQTGDSYDSSTSGKNLAIYINLNPIGIQWAKTTKGNSITMAKGNEFIEEVVHENKYVYVDERRWACISFEPDIVNTVKSQGRQSLGVLGIMVREKAALVP